MNIYTTILNQSSSQWLNNDDLKNKLLRGLENFSSGKQPIRTRKKTYKDKVCEILGFEIPSSYKRTKPMFPIMDFDVYVQQSNNLQIWNEEVLPSRRYVVIRVNEEGSFLTLKVITGEELASFDRTGTLTTKLQARLDIKNIANKLSNEKDTEALLPHIVSDIDLTDEIPSRNPQSGKVLPIRTIYERLLGIIGVTFQDSHSERLRGNKVHELCCNALGYSSFSDDGQFPDIRHQLLEVKLQTSPTIDVGKENPLDDTNKLSSLSLNVCNQDIRYAVVYAVIKDDIVTIKNIIVTNGENFFNTFPQMAGNVVNKKLQLPLPNNFFD